MNASISRRIGLFVKVAAVLVAVVAMVVAVMQVRSWKQRRVDARVIADVTEQVRVVLSSLSADSDIYQRYGPFLALEGSGFSRPRYAWQLVERVECGRRAVFRDGVADVYIMVSSQGPLSVNLTLVPSAQIVAEGAGERVVLEGNHVWFNYPDGVGSRSSIHVTATHPDYTD
jgi:hypothetical protein